MRRTPYGIQIIESCLACPFREGHPFCNLSPPAAEVLSAITKSSTYPKGAVLFVEGQEPHGVFIVCSGRVKLSISSSSGKTMILSIAEPGEMLGLSAAISGRCYQVAAETLEPSRVSFIARAALLEFMRDYAEVACKVAEDLSRACEVGFTKARSLGLGARASEKLAHLLLDLSANHHKGKSEARVKLTLTYEEMGQIIGSTRETVTRLMANFRMKQFVKIKGSTLTVRRAELENFLRIQ